MYIECALSRNSHSCLYQSSTSKFFETDPPQIQDYFSQVSEVLCNAESPKFMTSGYNSVQLLTCQQFSFDQIAECHIPNFRSFYRYSTFPFPNYQREHVHKTQDPQWWYSAIITHFQKVIQPQICTVVIKAQLGRRKSNRKIYRV